MFDIDKPYSFDKSSKNNTLSLATTSPATEDFSTYFFFQFRVKLFGYFNFSSWGNLTDQVSWSVSKWWSLWSFHHCCLLTLVVLDLSYNDLSSPRFPRLWFYIICEWWEALWFHPVSGSWVCENYELYDPFTKSVHLL